MKYLYLVGSAASLSLVVFFLSKEEMLEAVVFTLLFVANYTSFQFELRKETKK